MKYLKSILILTAFAWLPCSVTDAWQTPLTSEALKGVQWRGIGPAFMSGRIADIAIHPQDDSVWYVGVGSGGVWKTVNAGITWKPIFDDQTSYSIGCVTIDPQNPQTIWVGTGENVGGRHVGYGDGVYRSDDGGATWKNCGLKNSEHISKIIVHPRDSDTIWVAAQGPLWTPGGERGLYKSTDRGQTWNRVLGDAQWVGVTDVVLDPRQPKRMYAATWQRHRTVAAYLGGGPGSGLHRSLDGGQTWEKLTNGLPKSRMGKIGLAISPQRPDVLYAAIELDRRTGAVFRSGDRGMTWTKQSETVSGGTGPHYYQELYACPHHFERIYLADVRMQISDDGGKTFRRMKEKSKHSDNHALAFRMDDPNYLLAGSDGGLYESFDLAENWRFLDNLPVTQYYKLALDDSMPFYQIYGGTQDNSTQGGPSRTDNAHGIQNSDWRVILDWDGHQPATEPGNPNIVYAERQEGFLSRVDMSTGEVVDIQPQPEVDEDYERFNWDAPILVSPHDPARIYFASQRVWRSDNRGDEWKAISGDLTRNQDRFELPIMGRMQSWDNAWDVAAMSNYNTITSLAESPLQEGLIYAGTDDGIIQVTRDGGENWQRIEVGQLPGVPATAFVNDVRADLFDAETVYVALDNHKYGDYQPYLFKSRDAGKSWESISANLPDRTLVWRTVQDHVNRDLLFVATEFGIYVTIDAGKNWTKLQGGMPTISIRDIGIQRRENDLVAASFGRGFYVLDDISFLREITPGQLDSEAHLFKTRDAWWYFPRPQLGFEGGKGDQGASHYVAPNPPFGAVFTYYLKDDLTTRKSARKKRETEQAKQDQATPFPGWDQLEAENHESEPRVVLTVRDTDGRVVRRITGETKKGFHRVAWDLRYPPTNAIELIQSPPPLWGGPPQGLMVAPGTYSATLSRVQDGEVQEIAGAVTFEVVPLRKGGALPSASPAEVAAFWRAYENAVRTSSAIGLSLPKALAKIDRMRIVLQNSTAEPGDLDRRLHAVRQALQKLDSRFNGSPARREVGEKIRPTIQDRLFAVSRGVDRSTYGPTATHRRSLEIAVNQIAEIRSELGGLLEDLSQLTRDMVEAGAPWIEGESLPEMRDR